MLVIMTYSANNVMDTSQCSRLVEDFIKSFIEKIVTDRGFPRRVALSSVQKAAGLPITADGMSITRLMTENVMQRMVNQRVIESYRIEPRKENGAEWLYVQLFKAGAGADA